MRATLNEHRSTHAPFTVSDELLEFWGAVFLLNPRLRAQGVSFEQFVRAPALYLVGARVIVLRARPKAATTRAARAADVEGCERAVELLEREGAASANGRMVEKLRHHRHPRGAFRAFKPLRSV